MKRRAVWIGIAVIVGAAIVGAALWMLWPRGSDDTGPRAVTVFAEAQSEGEISARAQQQLDDHLEDCTRPADESPASCGIQIPWAADFTAVDGIRFRIEQPPVLTLTPPTFRADDGVLVATVTGVGLDGATKTLTYRTENWMLRGDVIVKRGGVVLTVW